MVFFQKKQILCGIFKEKVLMLVFNYYILNQRISDFKWLMAFIQVINKIKVYITSNVLF